MQVCFGGTSSSEVIGFTSSSNLETQSEDYNQRGDCVFRSIIVDAYGCLNSYMKRSMTINEVRLDVISDLVDKRRTHKVALARRIIRTTDDGYLRLSRHFRGRHLSWGN